MLADSHNISNRWKNYFCQLFNTHDINNVTQKEMHKAEPLGPKSSSTKTETAIEKLKRYKLPDNAKILTKLILAGGSTLCSKIHKHINFVQKKKELSQQWKESITVPTYIIGDKTDCINYKWISLLSTTYKISSNIVVSMLTLYIDKIIGDYQHGFWRNRSTTDQIFCIHQIMEKKWKSKWDVLYFEVQVSLMREVLYNIITEFVYTKTSYAN
jgi:hypothetical protein